MKDLKLEKYGFKKKIYNIYMKDPRKKYERSFFLLKKWKFNLKNL